MEEKREDLPREEEQNSAEETAKSPWQSMKESWYDKIPLNLKQLDIIIGACLTALALCFIAICPDAAGIYNFFG